jgi:hypothetical protein
LRSFIVLDVFNPLAGHYSDGVLDIASVVMGRGGLGRKVFFFKKKNQKTFAPGCVVWGNGGGLPGG